MRLPYFQIPRYLETIDDFPGRLPAHPEKSAARALESAVDLSAYAAPAKKRRG